MHGKLSAPDDMWLSGESSVCAPWSNQSQGSWERDVWQGVGDHCHPGQKVSLHLLHPGTEPLPDQQAELPGWGGPGSCREKKCSQAVGRRKEERETGTLPGPCKRPGTLTRGSNLHLIHDKISLAIFLWYFIHLYLLSSKILFPFIFEWSSPLYFMQIC